MINLTTSPNGLPKIAAPSFHTPPSNESQNHPATFHNPEIPKDDFLSKVANLSLDTEMSLPALDEVQLARMVEILTKPRILKGRKEAFEIHFTLAELFNFLLDQGEGATRIENVELVGSGVPWVLNEYVLSALSRLGMEKPEELVSQAMLQGYAKTPRDVDFRIFTPHATYNDILLIRNRIVDFFVLKTDPSFRSLILDTGFSKFTTPKGMDLMSTVGLWDAADNCGIDLVIYQHMQRDCLFIQDNLRLAMTTLIKNLKDAVLIPVSSVGNGCQAIIDRLAGVVRSVDISTINCAGWAAMLIRFLKGDRGISPAFEKALLDKIHASLVGHTNEIDMPKALYDKVVPLTNPAKKMAAATAYWLEKALDAHVGKDGAAALTLTLQACVSLKKHGYEDSIDELWALMKGRAKVPTDNILGSLIHHVMEHHKAFDKLIAVLEARASLLMNTSDQEAAFAPNLIMHNQKPALQIWINGFYLLLPYHGASAIPNLIMACESLTPELQKALEALDVYLQPKSPYKALAACPEKKAAPINYKPENLASFWDRMAAEWILASDKTTHSSKLIEECFLDLLGHHEDKGERMRLIESAENCSRQQEKKIYSTTRMLCSHKDYADVPLPMVWAMALASTEDPGRCSTAFALWKAHSGSLPQNHKIPFSMLLLSRIAVVRPDLAIEILANLEIEKIPYAKGLPLLKGIQAGFQKHSECLTEKSILLFTATAKKICQDNDKQIIQWNIEGLINHHRYADGFALAETYGLIPYYITCLGTDKTLPGLIDQHVDQPSTPKRLDAILSLLLACKQPKATHWKKVFEKIKSNPNKEICIKAWKGFCQYINRREDLQGTTLEIAEAWVQALRTVEACQAHLAADLFGHEDSFLSLFTDPATHPLRDKACFLLYDTVIAQSPEMCPADWICKLLKMRNSFGHILNPPQGGWIKADLPLAKLIPLSASPPLLKEAFKIYVYFGQDKPAEEILVSLIDSEITQEVMTELSDPFLTLFSRLPKNKIPAAWKLLSTPLLQAILKLNPRKGAEILMQWHERLDEINPKTTFLILIPLLEAVEDRAQLIAFTAKAINQLETLNTLSKKADLKQLLEKCHDRVVNLLEGDPILFTFLSSVKRLELKVNLTPSSIQSYDKMFANLLKESSNTAEVYPYFIWFKNVTQEVKGRPNDTLLCYNWINQLAKQNLMEEMEALFPGFLLNLDIEQLANCKPVWPSACMAISKKIILQARNQTVEAAWHLFWNFFLTQEQHRAQAGSCWPMIMPWVYEDFYDVYFDILQDIDKFAASIAHLSEKDQSVMIRYLLTRSSSHFVNREEKEKPKIFQAWIRAYKLFESKIISNPVVEVNVIYAQTTLYFLAGDKQQYQQALDNLYTHIIVCPLDLTSFLLLTQRLVILFSSPPTPRLTLFLASDEFKQYIVKSSVVLDSHETMPCQILAFYSLILNNHFSSDQTLVLLNEMMTIPPCRHLLECASLSLIKILRERQDLTKPEKKNFISTLKNILEIALKKKFSFSRNFFMLTMHAPFLEREMVENAENLAYIYNRILSINYFSELVAVTEYLDSVIAHMPFYVDNLGSDAFRIFFLCFINNRLFEYYPQVMASINTALSKFDPNHAEIVGFIFTGTLIQEFLNLQLQTVHDLEFVTHFLNKEFEKLISYKNVNETTFTNLLHEYVLYMYKQVPDEFHFNEKKSKWFGKHLANLHSIILKAHKKRRMLNNPSRLLQYQLLLGLKNPKNINLSSQEQEDAIQDLVDILLSKPKDYNMRIILATLCSLKEPFSTQTFISIWRNVAQGFSKVKSIKGVYAFEEYLRELFLPSVLSGPNRPAGWLEASAIVFTTLFEELCKPNCSVPSDTGVIQIDICLRVAKFLKQAAAAHCFDGHAKEYYELVQKLLTLVEPVLNEKDQESVKRLFLLVRTAIIPYSPALQQLGQVHAVQAMTRWIKMLAKSHCEEAEDTLRFAKIIVYDNPAAAIELEEITKIVRHAPPSQ